jgi:predicted secreted protein
MDIFTGIIVYLLIFWTSLFCILPIGIRRAQKEGGNDGGAPANPMILKRFLATAGLSAALWVIIFIMVETKVIDFRTYALGMVKQDAVARQLQEQEMK